MSIFNSFCGVLDLYFFLLSVCVAEESFVDNIKARCLPHAKLLCIALVLTAEEGKRNS